MRPREPSDQGDLPVPRWVQIPVGLALSAILLLCLAGSITIVVPRDGRVSFRDRAFGAGMVLVTLWAFSVCYRLVTGKRVCGGLLGPFALRAAAWCFLLMPVAGLLTALFTRQFVNPLYGLLVTAIDIGVFFRLRSLASHREGNET